MNRNVMTGIESNWTCGIHKALRKCRNYMRYAYRGEGLFANYTRPESLADHVSIGKELLEDIRRVMWRYHLTFISHFEGRESFTIVILCWVGERGPEWVTARYPIYIPKEWWTVPPNISGRYVLARALLAFLGVTQPPGYENHIEEMVCNEIEHERSLPTDELERRWDLGSEPDEEG